MGTDHQQMDDNAAWAAPLGLQQGALDEMPSGAFSRPSTTASHEQRQGAQEWAVAEAQRKTDEKEMKKATALQKPFEGAAMNLQLKPLYVERVKAVKASLKETIQSCEEKLQPVKSDPVLVSDALKADVLFGVASTPARWAALGLLALKGDVAPASLRYGTRRGQGSPAGG